MTENPITAEELAELRRLHEAATPGPWTSRKAYMDTDGAFDYGIVGHVDGELRVIAETFGRVAVSKFPPAKESAEFIAAARNALPRLLDEIERLRAVIRATHEGCNGWHAGGRHAPGCLLYEIEP